MKQFPHLFELIGIHRFIQIKKTGYLKCTDFTITSTLSIQLSYNSEQ